VDDVKAPRRPFAGRRFRLWYAVTWLDLAGLYTVVFLINGATLPLAVTHGLITVIPMALLGVGCLALFRRLDWNTPHRVRFIALHVVIGLVYGLLATSANYALSAVERWVRLGQFSWHPFNPEYFTWESVMGLMIYGVLAGVCYAILLHGRMREQERRAAQALALRTQAELRALRAQLNPHFLFNTLHSLLSLVRHDASAAEDGLEQFGDLLRYTLDTQKKGDAERVTLGEEMAFVRNYLALESLRLGERMKLDIDVDEEILQHRVPAFCLQPLVENAVQHGIAPRAAGGTLTLRGRRRESSLVFEVRDDGPGCTPEQLAGGNGKGNGMGLRIARERVAAIYGDAASLRVETAPGRGFAVELRIPVEDGERDA
jgi:signal transduction histidine kinase